MTMNNPPTVRAMYSRTIVQRRLKFITLLLVALIALPIGSLTGGNVASAQSRSTFVINAPTKAQVGQPIEFSFIMTNAANVAAYEAVMLFDPNAAEFHFAEHRGVGLRAGGRDVEPLSTIDTSYGLAIGAYTCSFGDCVTHQGTRQDNGANGRVTFGSVAIVPTVAGQLEVKFDSIKIVDANGIPVTATVPKQSFVISIGNSDTLSSAPAVPWTLPTTSRNAPGPFDITGDGQVDHADAAEIGMAWTLLREHGEACGVSVDPLVDVNHDGCVDVADLQLVAANYGPVPATSGTTTGVQSESYLTAALASDSTPVDAMRFQSVGVYVVDSTGDEDDVSKTDGLCLTSVGTCTFRAALQQSNQRNGPDRIEFNIPGGGVKTINITTDLPTLWNGNLTIDGYTQPGSSPNTNTANRGSNAVLMIQLIGGGESNFPGLKITSSGNIIRGLALSKFNRPFWLYKSGASNNTIAGNFIGTNAAGTYGAARRASTQSHGVHAELGASNNIIGGTDPADRNVLSGNGRHGVGLWHSDTLNNKVINNVIGLKPMGDGALTNHVEGVDMNYGASNTEVRGNVSSGNGLAGVDLSHNNNTTGNLVIDNYIGTDVTGTRSLPYTANNYGLRIKDGVRNNTVTQNVIGTNIEAAIDIQDDYTTRNTITNNLIGITLDGTAAGSPIGIRIGGSSNTIGPDNVITNHTNQGVLITLTTADFNKITRNSIYNNGGLGIDLNPIGVNPNDADDADSGANQQLNYPVLATATAQAVTGTACASCIVEVFIADSGSGQHGEGKTFVGSGTASASGDFTIPVSGVTGGDFLTSTATDPTGNTSEFSLNIQATQGAGVPAAPSALAATAASDDQIDLSWTDNATDETAYTVERSLNQTDWTVLTSTLPADSISYSDIGLEPSTEYFYRVKATNVAGDSGYSNTDSATTDPPPPSIPADPTGLAATAVSDDQINLSWTDNATDETAYTVERSLDQTDWTVVTSTLVADSTSYSDTGLDPATLYYYRVKATNAAGDSDYSNIDSATTNGSGGGGIPLPGRIEAEDYKAGGEGSGYHDTTAGNSGGEYRTDDVDIQTTADSSGAFNVGWIEPGEWLAYDVNVTATGSYRFILRVASPANNKQFHLELDGVNITGSITVPNTGNFQNWTNVTINNIALSAGTHELRFVAETNRFNLNYFIIESMP